MHPERGPSRTAPPYSRFRCLVCREYVVGTATGHCPRCGFVPPTARAMPPIRAPISLAAVVAIVAFAIAAVVYLYRG